MADLITYITRMRSRGDKARVRSSALREAASSGPLSGVLVYTEDPIVSSDIIGSPASCTFDSGLTMVTSAGDGSTLVKALGWYDNEWGYSNRLVDLALVVGGSGR